MGRGLLPLFSQELWNMHNWVLNELPRQIIIGKDDTLVSPPCSDKNHPSVLDFIKTLKLDASHKLMSITQMLADAAPPPHKRV